MSLVALFECKGARNQRQGRSVVRRGVRCSVRGCVGVGLRHGEAFDAALVVRCDSMTLFRRREEVPTD